MAKWSWTLSFVFLLVITFGCVVKSQSEHETGITEEDGVIGEGVIDSYDAIGAAEGVGTKYYFPDNPQRLIPAGEPAEILVGIFNTGGSTLNINAITASIHLPFDHKLLVQNLTTQEFVNATVAPGVQATFSYPFTVSKMLHSGSFAMVATVFYDIGGDIHKNVFFNGTIEVLETGGLVSGETLFLVTLGLALLGLLGMWIHGQVQRFSKTRRSKAVETGTRNTDAINDEWLKGTSFIQKPKQQKKQKKQK